MKNKFIKLLAISAVIFGSVSCKDELLQLVKKRQTLLPMIYKVKK